MWSGVETMASRVFLFEHDAPVPVELGVWDILRWPATRLESTSQEGDDVFAGAMIVSLALFPFAPTTLIELFIGRNAAGRGESGAGEHGGRRAPWSG